MGPFVAFEKGARKKALSLWAALHLFVAGAVTLAGALSGCARAPASGAAVPAASAESGLFVNEYLRSGIDFTLGHGGKTPLNILETLGHGAAMLDFDGDGRLDLLFLGPSRVALYRNLGDWRFEDVTAASGLKQPGFWQGVAFADVDGDGRVDLYLCGYGVHALYRNLGGGGFEDVTAMAFDNAGPSTRGAGRGEGPETPWNSSAGFADIDGDGWLDLYVARYVHFGPETPQLCETHLPGLRSVCPPKAYEPQRGVLYRNLGRTPLRFRDETGPRGLATAHGNGLGVAWGDYDDDGRVDLAVANDELPGDLFHNRGGRFVNVGVASGTAYDAEGRVHAGMGIDWGDLDGDGRLDLVVTTFWGETNNLYRNEGDGFFRDIAVQTPFARVGRAYVGFGVKFFDLDNDGDLDLVIANGHVADNADRLRRGDSYAQPTLLFRNDGGHFVDITREGGAAFTRPIVGRGVCVGDLDDDGRLDLIVTNVEGPPLLLRNRSGPRGNWLRVALLRHGSANQHGIGARVTVRAGGRAQRREATTAGSFLSASDPRLHFGLGDAASVEEIVVRWPDGKVSRRKNVPANRQITIEEP